MKKIIQLSGALIFIGFMVLLALGSGEEDNASVVSDKQEIRKEFNDCSDLINYAEKYHYDELVQFWGEPSKKQESYYNETIGDFIIGASWNSDKIKINGQKGITLYFRVDIENGELKGFDYDKARGVVSSDGCH